MSENWRSSIWLRSMISPVMSDPRQPRLPGQGGYRQVSAEERGDIARHTEDRGPFRLEHEPAAVDLDAGLELCHGESGDLGVDNERLVTQFQPVRQLKPAHPLVERLLADGDFDGRALHLQARWDPVVETHLGGLTNDSVEVHP